MPSIAQIAREKLSEAVSEIDKDEFTLEDTLRAFQEQSKLMAVTEQVREAVDAKALSALYDMTVVDYHKVATRDDYSTCLASVQFQKKDRKSPVIQLYFRYERRPEGSPTISYSIDVVSDGRTCHRQSLLWIHIWAAGNGHTGPTADCVLISDESDEEVPLNDEAPPKKKQRVENDAPLVSKEETERLENDETSENSASCDHYLVDVDPGLFDAIAPILGIERITEKDHGDILSLLLSFPFYEGEWDLPGMLFDAVFEDETENPTTVTEER